MGHAYQEIAFTPAVKARQEADGSRAAYARREGGPDHADRLGPEEAAFIAARDSFYLSSVSETGWPYIQHRGGPVGFVRVLDDRTLAVPDYRGNRQHITAGNLDGDDRVALFFMDYPNRRRLKLFGRARTADLSELDARADGDPGRALRTTLIAVAALDWNCPQFITPRFTAAELEAMAQAV